MALKAFEEEIAAPLSYIMTGLEQHRYSYLDEARLAFVQILNQAKRNKFAKELMYNRKYVNYICDRMTQIPAPERRHEIHGSEYHRNCAIAKYKSNSYSGPLLKPGDYQNNKWQFIEERRLFGPWADIYNLNIAGLEKENRSLASRFRCYFINKDGLVHKHIDAIKLVLRDDLYKKAIAGFLWLPLVECPSAEVKNTLKDIADKYLITGCGYGLGLKFKNAVTIKQFGKTLSTLSRYLSQAELNTLCRIFWLSQNHPLKPNVLPQLFLPRLKDAESIIRKMKFYAENKNLGREIVLSDITDITGACLAVEDYFAIENMMNLIRSAISRDFILEEENLYYENKKEKPYRDVKYIIRLSHPTMENPSNHICYELQIKIIDSKIFHDIDHVGIYKSELSLHEKDLLKQPFWGQLWIKEKQLLEEYVEINQKYQNWHRTNFPD
jgi:ppGpp synthetase/RelA/SpoT-type nucleotidyltranferase